MCQAGNCFIIGRDKDHKFACFPSIHCNALHDIIGCTGVLLAETDDKNALVMHTTISKTVWWSIRVTSMALFFVYCACAFARISNELSDNSYSLCFELFFPSLVGITRGQSTILIFLKGLTTFCFTSNHPLWKMNQKWGSWVCSSAATSKGKDAFS